MATLDQTIDIPPTTPNPDFEPEEEWKKRVRQHIEDSLKPAAEKLKRELNEKLGGFLRLRTPKLIPTTITL